MATPTLIDVSRGAIDVNLQTAIPGATVRSQLSGDLRTSYQAQWDTGQPGINLKNNSSWNFLGTNLSNSQITMFLLEGVTDYQKQQMVAWRDQCIDPDRDGTREFIFQITVNTTFASTGAWHGQSKYTCFARYFGSSDWNNRVDRIYFGLVNDSSIGGNAVTSTASSSISEMMTKIATGVVGNIRYSLSGISIWFDDQEDDTLGPPDETIHNFRSTFQQEVCLNDVDVVVESPRVLALLEDADGNDCIIETTVPSGGGGGGADIAIEEGGTQVVAAATIINFDGSDFDVADNGSGKVTITTTSTSGATIRRFEVTTNGVNIPGSPADAALGSYNTSTGSWTINHGIGNDLLNIQIYVDGPNSGEKVMILPDEITAINQSTIRIDFGESGVAGYAVVTG